MARLSKQAASKRSKKGWDTRRAGRKFARGTVTAAGAYGGAIAGAAGSRALRGKNAGGRAGLTPLAVFGAVQGGKWAHQGASKIWPENKPSNPKPHFNKGRKTT